MSGLFAFRCWTPEHPLPISTLIVFCGPNEFAYQELITAISEETRRALSPEAVYLVFAENAIDKVKAAIKADESAFAPLSSDTIIGLYSYDDHGNATLNISIRSHAPSKLPLDHIRRQGLTELFQRHSGLLESGPTAHFVKPSKRIDTRFLRASHALSEGSEIFFVSFWLLPMLTNDIEVVHLDTSSIASVVMAALLMRGNRRIPAITTFHSYEGIKSHPFNIDRADLVLVSASQSGTMAELLETKVKDPTRVVTLFSTADVVNGKPKSLCDLRYNEDTNPLGYPPPSSADKPASATRPIRLIGEHFVAELEPPRAIVPGIDHAPTVVKETIAKLQGLNVFSAYRSGASGDGRQAIWVDVANLQRTEAFKSWVHTIVARHIPAATRAIVYSGRDPLSDLLAQEIMRELEAHGGNLADVRFLRLSEIEEGLADWQSPGSPVVVTSGATGHGTELQAISRALRRYAPASHRIFLSAATMVSSKRAFSILKSNLKQPDHTFLSMFEIFVDRERSAESWNVESLYLLDHEDALPNSLSDRLNVLNSNSTGLVTDLFLSGAKGPLTLRDNFAFWPGPVDCSKATQADVFASMSAILENMRTGEGVKPQDRLKNDVQNHSLISGEAFARFNDGVIQAALLRASLPIELNYEDAEEQSRLIAKLIVEMAHLSHRPQGEALTEFLLALATGRMRLMKEDRKKVSACLSSLGANLSEPQRWLASRLVAGDGT